MNTKLKSPSPTNQLPNNLPHSSTRMTNYNLSPKDFLQQINCRSLPIRIKNFDLTKKLKNQLDHFLIRIDKISHNNSLQARLLALQSGTRHQTVTICNRIIQIYRLDFSSTVSVTNLPQVVADRPPKATQSARRIQDK